MVRILRNTLVSGLISSLATTLATALFAKKEHENPAAPINAVSHIAFGDEAFKVDKPVPKFFVTGLVLNTLATIFWAGLQELVVKQKDGKPDVKTALAAGAAVSGLAYVTDYHVVPKRLTPGFEEKLSKKSLVGVYAVLAVALAAGALLADRD